MMKLARYAQDAWDELEQARNRSGGPPVELRLDVVRSAYIAEIRWMLKIQQMMDRHHPRVGGDLFAPRNSSGRGIDWSGVKVDLPKTEKPTFAEKRAATLLASLSFHSMQMGADGQWGPRKQDYETPKGVFVGDDLLLEALGADLSKWRALLTTEITDPRLAGDTQQAKQLQSDLIWAWNDALKEARERLLEQQ